MGNLIKVEDLVKKFDEFTAVNKISFEVYKGECLGILGPNGAGKTTTVKMIQCVSPITSGSIEVFGESASLDKRNIRARLGVVPQENDLDTDLTVIQNITLFARFFDINKKIANDRAEKLLKFFELWVKKDDLIDKLSGGMKRRLLLARALINEPELMILDEPTTGLDPQARHLIWQRLRTLKEQGVTIVLNTQYMDEAEQICDRLVILDKGKILKEGKPKELVKGEVGEEVVEVRNHGQSKSALATLDGLEFNSEEIGDTLYIYCRESKEIVKRLAEQENISVLRRPATLEDLFLRLTGRGLSE